MQRDLLGPLLGKDLAPPAHRGDQRQGDADPAHGGVGDEPEKRQGDPERQD
jgi:hypothetical protein